MTAKKFFSMDALTDLMMRKLFQLAEFVCHRYPFVTVVPAEVPVPSKDDVPTIRFTHEDKMVEGELFEA